MKTVILKVEGMSCHSCVASVERKLKSVIGVQTTQVSLSEGKATVLYDEQRTEAAKLVESVEEAGYVVRLETLL